VVRHQVGWFRVIFHVDRQQIMTYPLTDNQIWGCEDTAVDFDCPLKEGGYCPMDCNRCKDFQLEMEGIIATESTEDTEK